MACSAAPLSPFFHSLSSPKSNRKTRRTCDGRVSFSRSSPLLCLSCSADLNIGKDMSFQLRAMSGALGSTIGTSDSAKFGHDPDHLLVLVHGIMSSPSDWTYAEAELKRQLGSNFLIYVSSSNKYAKTFDGIDGAGKRLADEVMQVVKETSSLKNISFLAHSLGGLFARYAIGSLYSSSGTIHVPQDDLAHSRGNTEVSKCSSKLGTVAGLQPINFITLATPHLGVRGKKQLPFLLGLPILEKLAPSIAPILIGQTGPQLFLADGNGSESPLLLRMASDCEDVKFISSLAAFRSRTLYANVSYDHMVGWRTSSIRRETELVEPSLRSLEGYQHIVEVKYCPPILSESHHKEATSVKKPIQLAINQENMEEHNVIIEEEMISGLQRVGWKKVDVSFHSVVWPFFAHNNIHVKHEWINNAGAGVIRHVVDNLKEQESSSFIIANICHFVAEKISFRLLRAVKRFLDPKPSQQAPSV